jgi:hypothetical protein
MRIKVVKKADATEFGAGRGMDNTASGGTYVVLRDGKAVGSILPNTRRCYNYAAWEVFEYTFDADDTVFAYKSLKRVNGRFDPKPFKLAKEFALAYFARHDVTHRPVASPAK